MNERQMRLCAAYPRERRQGTYRFLPFNTTLNYVQGSGVKADRDARKIELFAYYLKATNPVTQSSLRSVLLNMLIDDANFVGKGGRPDPFILALSSDLKEKP